MVPIVLDDDLLAVLAMARVEPFHLIVQETLALLRASLPSTIELRQSIAADSGMALADPTQLQQVVMNLCTNAEHAMRPKGGRLEICLDSVDIDTAMAIAMPELTPGCSRISAWRSNASWPRGRRLKAQKLTAERCLLHASSPPGQTSAGGLSGRVLQTCDAHGTTLAQDTFFLACVTASLSDGQWDIFAQF